MDSDPGRHAQTKAKGIMSATRVTIVRHLLSNARRTSLVVLLLVAATQLISTASAHAAWCGSASADFVCKLNGAATIGPIPSAAQLRRGEVSALAPGTDLTVFKGGVARLNLRTEANCQFGPARGTTSIRSRFADALLRFDKGKASASPPGGPPRGSAWHAPPSAPCCWTSEEPRPYSARRGATAPDRHLRTPRP